MNIKPHHALLGVVALAATALYAAGDRNETVDAATIEAIKVSAAAERVPTGSLSQGWGEVWGVAPTSSPSMAPTVVASARDTSWGEVWGLEMVASATGSSEIDTLAIETASTPEAAPVDAAWGEVWGVGAEDETLSVAATVGWGEVWGVEPTLSGVEAGEIATASIPNVAAGAQDEAWGEVWGLE